MNKKVPVILIGILILVTLIILFTFKNDDSSVVVYEDNYLILGNDSFWVNNGNEWQSKNVSKWDKSNEMLVYVDGLFNGIYKGSYINSWNFLDDEGNYLNYEDKVLAISSGLDIDIKQLRDSEVLQEDIDYINNLTSNNYSLFDIDKIFIQKSAVDLNNDGVFDYVISVNNFDDEYLNYYFNLIYVKIDDKISILLNDKIEARDVLLKPTYNLYYVVNFHNIGIPHIIFKATFFSMVDTPKYLMYTLNNEKFELVVED